MKRGRRKLAELEMVSVGPDFETTCTICYAEFLEPSDLTEHLKQVHYSFINRLKKCQFCPLYFSNIEDVAVHLRDNHVKDLTACEYCSRTFINKKILKSHERKHLSTSSIACSQCSLLFDTSADVEVHEFQHHKDAKDGVFLQEYFSVLSTLLNMNAKVMITMLCNKSTLQNYSCISCSYNCKELDSYLGHLQKSNCRSKACDSCYNAYSSKSKLFEHIRSRRECQLYINDENLVKKCKKCHKMIDYTIFKRHFKNCKPIKCNTCDIIFNDITELSEHASKTHQNVIKVHSCQKCSKEFVGIVALNRHVDKVHNSTLHLYKYPCKYCGEKFRHPKVLFGHFVSKHKEVIPYTCQICDKKFKYRKKFTIHIKLEHKSIGFVDFDENYHVIFTDKKPEKVDSDKISHNDNDTQPPSTKPTDKSLDFMTETDGNITETDGNVTEIDKKIESDNSQGKNDEIILQDDNDVEIWQDSDDEPLIQSKTKRKAKKLSTRKKLSKDLKTRFTCNICNKYCYTFQNYHNHMSLHNKSEIKNCIKCDKSFKTKKNLQHHISVSHSSSELTETLRKVLEKRKIQMQNTDTTETTSCKEKFQLAFKKVDLNYTGVPVTIRCLEKNSFSVQTFIENFTPELNERSYDKQELPKEESVVTIKVVKGVKKYPSVKMKKINFTNLDYKMVKPRMPIKFHNVETQKYKVNVSLVTTEKSKKSKLNFGEFDHNSNSNDCMDDDFYSYDNNELDYKHETAIPDVAEEVMLEDNSEIKQIPKKTLYLPKIPEGCNETIRIAQLLPVAPYYKIVKVDQFLKENYEMHNKSTETNKKEVTLPNGTKLVQVNPLAHLIKDNKLNAVLEANKNRYYKPKHIDSIENVLAAAMMSTSTQKKQNLKRKKNMVEEFLDDE